MKRSIHFRRLMGVAAILALAGGTLSGVARAENYHPYGSTFDSDDTPPPNTPTTDPCVSYKDEAFDENGCDPWTNDPPVTVLLSAPSTQLAFAIRRVRRRTARSNILSMHFEPIPGSRIVRQIPNAKHVQRFL